MCGDGRRRRRLFLTGLGAALETASQRRTSTSVLILLSELVGQGHVAPPLPFLLFVHLQPRVVGFGQVVDRQRGQSKVNLYEAGSAFAEGPSAGKAIGEKALNDALLEYYRLRGWDEAGKPTEARLSALGVDVRL